ncbi:MAG: carbonic anhydrase [Parachlamydiaceae bacterium]
MKIFTILTAIFFIHSLEAGEALDRLKEGNKRYLANDLKLCYDIDKPRLATVDKQKPFATIMGCSDSRVPPELLFDQTIGDLFVVRTAGNVCGPIEQDSIDYSVIHLGSKVILVVGHENCGAVQAVMARQTAGIEAVAEQIAPFLHETKPGSALTLEEAVKINIRHVMQEIAKSREVAQLLKEGKVEVAGAYYQASTGRVEFLE